MPAACVEASRQSLERLRHRHEFLTFTSLSTSFAQARFLFERLVERHLQIVGNEFGDPVDLGVGHFEDAADIANGGLAFMVPKVMICATWSSPYFG